MKTCESSPSLWSYWRSKNVILGKVDLPPHTTSIRECQIFSLVLMTCLLYEKKNLRKQIRSLSFFLSSFLSCPPTLLCFLKLTSTIYFHPFPSSIPLTCFFFLLSVKTSTSKVDGKLRMVCKKDRHLPRGSWCPLVAVRQHTPWSLSRTCSLTGDDPKFHQPYRCGQQTLSTQQTVSLMYRKVWGFSTELLSSALTLRTLRLIITTCNAVQKELIKGILKAK